MNLSAPFITRPIATTLLGLGIALAGITAFNFLPVASLPRIDFPTIVVSASFPGTNPEVMATAVVTPLEKQLGRISGVSGITSTSNSGSANIAILFDLTRDINGASRDVQAAINASLGQLPTELQSNPTYRKVNPADSPILIMTLTSKVHEVSTMYDFASTILQQKLSKVEGVGQVQIGGSSLPAIRVTINPTALHKYNLDFQKVADIVGKANINQPAGQLANAYITRDIVIDNGQLFKPLDYQNLILNYQNNAAIKLSDVAEVTNSVENILNIGLCDNQGAVVLIIFKEPGANVIKTVDNIKKIMPIMQSSIPNDINLGIILDRTTTIRASLFEVEMALIVAILLVIAVVYIFLGNARAALIPSVAVPLSLCGTFAMMYLLDYSLDNLSLIALTIATGFVVDDAVVVLENITRHIDQGIKPVQAALKGASEVGFTVLSMSLSLIAVFIPILLMGGIVGRLFREFAVTLSVAILVSLLISLTITPMMCAKLLRKETTKSRTNKLVQKIQDYYGKTLKLALNHPWLILVLFASSLVLSILVFSATPKGFFPEQDTGGIVCSIQADQNMSFKELEKKLRAYISLAHEEPAVEHAAGFVGGNGSGFMFITLKPLDERKISAQQVIEHLREKVASVSGANLYMQVPQDIVIGGRHSSSQFQYTLSSNSMELLREWSPKVVAEIAKIPGIVDVNTDQRDHGLQVIVKIDYDAAANLGITNQQIDQQLFGAFGQKTITTLFHERTQSNVIMTVADKYWLEPDALKNIYIPASTGKLVPLSAVAKFEVAARALAINHQSQFPSITVSFNLRPNVAIGDAVKQVENVVKTMGLPNGISGGFNGTAQAFQSSAANEVLLLVAAILVVYLVLGILYENMVHPLTILSTLPSAGLGALLALYFANIQLTVIALIGIILLIGIVKKNAIMMIDFAIYIRNTTNKSASEAIYEAAQLRLRPIVMTTMAALLGALPLALAQGVGSELRRPLGITIIGGLVLSQLLTLYTTPVIYLILEKISNYWQQQVTRLWSKNEKIYLNN